MWISQITYEVKSNKSHLGALHFQDEFGEIDILNHHAVNNIKTTSTCEPRKTTEQTSMFIQTQTQTSMMTDMMASACLESTPGTSNVLAYKYTNTYNWTRNFSRQWISQTSQHQITSTKVKVSTRHTLFAAKKFRDGEKLDERQLAAAD